MGARVWVLPELYLAREAFSKAVGMPSLFTAEEYGAHNKWVVPGDRANY